MTKTYKTIKFDPSQFTVLHGKAKYVTELVPGTLDVWVEWKATEPVQVWLNFQSGLKAPYSNGVEGQFSVRVTDILEVVFETAKTSTVLACVSYRDISVTEKLDYTPAIIAPPAPAELQLSKLVNKAVQKQLAAMGIDVQGQLLVDDEDDLEFEDEGEDFGTGYMEVDEPVDPKPRKKASAQPEPEPPSGGNPVEAPPPRLKRNPPCKP